MKKLLLYFTLLLCVSFMNAQTIGIVGPAAAGWPDDDNQTDIMLTDNGDGTHTISALTLTTGPAKFRQDQAWTVNWGGTDFPSGPAVLNSPDNIPVQAGVYDIVFDLNNNTYTFTDVATFTEIELVGSALAASAEMSTIDGENYELSVAQFGDGDILFQEVGTSNTFGDSSFPTGTATSGGAAIPVSSGYYEVSFNLTTGDYTFTVPIVGIVGPAANGWPPGAQDIQMNSTDGDVYSLNSQALNDGDLKFRQNLSWDVNWGGTAFPSGSAVFNSSDNIPVVAGTYDISFFRTSETYTFVSLSAEDLSFENFKLYPNPTNDIWIFENPSKTIAQISIYDTFGKLIEKFKPNSNSGRVNAQTFSQGIYLAKVRLSDDSETTVKIIKR